LEKIEEVSDCSEVEETDDTMREKIKDPKCLGKLVKYPVIDI